MSRLQPRPLPGLIRPGSAAFGQRGEQRVNSHPVGSDWRHSSFQTQRESHAEYPAKEKHLKAFCSYLKDKNQTPLENLISLCNLNSRGFNISRSFSVSSQTLFTCALYTLARPHSVTPRHYNTTGRANGRERFGASHTNLKTQSSRSMRRLSAAFIF